MTAPISVTILAVISSTYVLPAISNPSSSTISCTLATGTPWVGLVTINPTSCTLKLSPTVALIGSSSFTVSLGDGVNPLVPYSFTVTVIASALPSFATALTTKSLNAGAVLTYILPPLAYPYSDVTISIASGPVWVTLLAATLSITPTNLMMGTYPVVINLSDGVNAPVSNLFNVIIAN